jgi:hypothetical protein
VYEDADGRAGEMQVKPVQGNNAARSAYIEELLQQEQQAQAAGVGMCVSV